MKALTLTQPWATLIAIGAKRIETRSWPTTYRGPVAIHAARTETSADVCAARHPAFADKLKPAGFQLGPGPHGTWNVPRGAVVAVCRIEACVRVEALERQPITPYEAAFGNYEPGRYAWRLTDVRPLRAPVSWRGLQRLWPVPPELASAIEALL